MHHFLWLLLYICKYDYHGLIGLTSFQTYYLVLVFSLFQSMSITKQIKNTVGAPFGIMGVSTEQKNNLSANPIIESKICFLLEIERYYFD